MTSLVNASCLSPNKGRLVFLGLSTMDLPKMTPCKPLFSVAGGSGWRGTQLRVPRPAGSSFTCAERPTSLIFQAGLVCDQRKPPTLAKGHAVMPDPGSESGAGPIRHPWIAGQARNDNVASVPAQWCREFRNSQLFHFFQCVRYSTDAAGATQQNPLNDCRVASFI